MWIGIIAIYYFLYISKAVLHTIARAYMGCVEENIGQSTPDCEPRGVKWRPHKMLEGDRRDKPVSSEH